MKFFYIYPTGLLFYLQKHLLPNARVCSSIRTSGYPSLVVAVIIPTLIQCISMYLDRLDVLLIIQIPGVCESNEIAKSLQITYISIQVYYINNIVGIYYIIILAGVTRYRVSPRVITLFYDLPKTDRTRDITRFYSHLPRVGVQGNAIYEYSASD